MIFQAGIRVKQAFRPSTWQNYIAMFRLYIKYAIAMSFDPTEPHITSIWAFTQLLVNSGYTSGTIKNQSAVEIVGSRPSSNTLLQLELKLEILR